MWCTCGWRRSRTGGAPAGGGGQDRSWPSIRRRWVTIGGGTPAGGGGAEQEVVHQRPALGHDRRCTSGLWWARTVGGAPAASGEALQEVVHQRPAAGKDRSWCTSGRRRGRTGSGSQAGGGGAGRRWYISGRRRDRTGGASAGGCGAGQEVVHQRAVEVQDTRWRSSGRHRSRTGDGTPAAGSGALQV
ncbi:loricrin-like [Scylla paramamosain]|uniref:loricrin-like n=1 Tax=Scylla paramamosain TaxID=85552 RepID=UPI003082FE46